MTLVCLARRLAALGAGAARSRSSAPALFGAAWAFIPGYLQAKRGSHVVITTIMFNFIASALVVYLLVNVLKVPGSMAPETRNFPEGTFLPFMHEMLAVLGITMSQTPMNLTSILALVAAFLDLGADLAHPARLRDARLRPFRAGGGLCRHRPGADHHHRHADLRRDGRR